MPSNEGDMDAPQEVSGFEKHPCGALFRDLVVASTQGLAYLSTLRAIGAELVAEALTAPTLF
jgi:hypothetical protein